MAEKNKEETKRLDDLAKRIRKLKKSGLKIIVELESDDLHHSLSEKYARGDFMNAIDWMNEAVNSKEKFMK